jgi:hypothetical protein
MAENPDYKPVSKKAAQTARSGRATTSPTLENTTVSPSGGPSSDDCYTVLLHNPDHDPGSSVSKRSGNDRRGCCGARRAWKKSTSILQLQTS